MSEEMARRQLTQANEYIAQAEQYIAVQEEILTQLEDTGHDTRAAQALLVTLINTWQILHVHRKLLLRELATIASIKSASVG